MKRRDFIRICGTTLAAAHAGRLLAAADQPLRRFARARLEDSEGRPLRAAELVPDQPYIFFYPFAGTPVYLINLGTLTLPTDLTTADGTAYHWAGGVGPQGRVVAFSAICTHLLTHPTRRMSFINYHAQADKLSGRLNVITCCAHGSVFDPARGAQVISGPATQPLMAIELEYDAENDGLHALGVRGGDLFTEFFDSFKRELREEFGRGAARKLVREAAQVRPVEDYVQQVLGC